MSITSCPISNNKSDKADRSPLKRLKKAIYRRIQKYYYALRIRIYKLFKKINKNTILLYWCREHNFGDYLGKELLEAYGFKVLFAHWEDADVVSVGSVLQTMPNSFNGYILGSGFIDKSVNDNVRFKALLVRGQLSKDILDIQQVALGDPGLIIDKYYSRATFKYKIGIVPHYVDLNDPKLIQLTENNPQIRLIDVRNYPQNVIHDISECENIISSSLHGLVIADSLGIPNKWIKISENLRGGDFKFMDYYSAFNEVNQHYQIKGQEEEELLLSLCTRRDPKVLEKVKNDVSNAYEQFINNIY